MTRDVEHIESPLESDEQLNALADAFERDVRWRFKLLSRAPIEDQRGRKTKRPGGWSGILRRVEVGGESILLKTWPLLAMLESFGANLAQMTLAHDSRWLLLTMEKRVRHHRRRTRQLRRAGIRVPRLYPLEHPRVLALEYLEKRQSLAELARASDVETATLLALYTESASALRAIHDAGLYHGEPGAGNVLIHRNAPRDTSPVAFIDFETVYKSHLTLRERQALDLRYFALQQAARLAKHHADPGGGESRWNELAESALRAIYDGYGESPLFDMVLDYSQTGPTMLYEAWGTLFVGLDEQRRVQEISDRVLAARTAHRSF
jgi:tRNA A-37 threonylcarbamoyl transferase component Bud32